MKKAYLCFLLSIVLGIMTACGGLQVTFSLIAKDIITDEMLSFDYYCQESVFSGTDTYFIEKSNVDVYDDIFDTAEKDGYIVELYQDEFLVIKSNQSTYMLRAIDGEEEQGYVFSSMVFYIGEMKTFHFPYHLVSGNDYYPVMWDSQNVDVVEYIFKTDAELEQIVEFYEHYNLYTIEETTGGIIVSRSGSEESLEIILSDGKMQIELI